MLAGPNNSTTMVDPLFNGKVERLLLERRGVAGVRAGELDIPPLEEIKELVDIHF